MAENSTLKRRAETLDLLQEKGKISVPELSKKYKVSEVTIRNDLAHLEKKGLLVKTRGGAIKSQPSSLVLSLHQKQQLNYPEKQKIGRAAAKYVQDGYSVVIDSGSTALEVAKNLSGFKNLTLITNSLPIADICANYEGIRIIISGGELRADMRSLIGSIAEKNILKYNCDLAIIGADSISPKKGIYTPLNDDALVSSAMISIANKVIVVIDSAKFKKKSLVKIADSNQIDVVITDDKIDADFAPLLNDFGVELVVVQ